MLRKEPCNGTLGIMYWCTMRNRSVVTWSLGTCSVILGPAVGWNSHRKMLFTSPSFSPPTEDEGPLRCCCCSSSSKSHTSSTPMAESWEHRFVIRESLPPPPLNTFVLLLTCCCCCSTVVVVVVVLHPLYSIICAHFALRYHQVGLGCC